MTNVLQKQEFSKPIFEETTCTIVQLLTDALGEKLASDQLGAVTITLTDQRTKAILNGLERASVKNAGRGVLTDVAGQAQLTLTLIPDDNALVNRNTPDEVHVLSLEWEFGEGGASRGLKEFYLTVIPRAVAT